MHSIRKAVVGAVVVGSTLTGGAIGAALLNGTANAQSSTATTTSSSNSIPNAARAPADPSMGGHVGANGVREELLTDGTAEKVKAAALAAVPGGTIQRVETDAEGSPYEAHMTKSDGAHVTVKVDKSFAVTSVEDGPR